MEEVFKLSTLGHAEFISASSLMDYLNKTLNQCTVALALSHAEFISASAIVIYKKSEMNAL